MKIIIDDDWYITADPLNYILNYEHDFIDKDGNNKRTSSVIGYYPSVEIALAFYLKKNRSHLTYDFYGTIDDYIDKIYEINNEAVEKVKKCKVENC